MATGIRQFRRAVVVLLLLVVGVPTTLVAGIQPPVAKAAPVFAGRTQAKPPAHPPGPGKPAGIVHPGSRTPTSKRTATPPAPLTYHGGLTMHVNTTYAIYWSPSGSLPMSAGYQPLINQFLGDVTAASGTNGNVYGTDTQYYDTTNGNITYASTFATSYVDTDAFPGNGCTDPSKSYATCLTDAQIAAELVAFTASHGLSNNIDTFYMLMFPPHIASCFDASSTTCSTNAYCAYHSQLFGTGTDLLYGVLPYVTDYPAASEATCLTGPAPGGEEPNGDVADDAINLISHEHNEAITDPNGDAWYTTSDFFENGDNCVWTFGATLGSTGKAANSEFDQVINGHDYYIQQEWSNASTACEMAATSDPPSVSLVTPDDSALAGGGTVTINGAQFTGATTVHFGSVAGTNLAVANDGQLTVTAPAQAAGTIDVRVITGRGTSAVTYTDVFYYLGSSEPYAPLPPVRILDTRAGSHVGPYTTPFGPNTTLPVPILGLGGVPISGVSAVVLNVTVTDTTAPSYLTIWPSGSTQPTASSLNWTAGVTVPNLVEVSVGADGNILVYNLAGNTDVIMDVQGYVGTAAVTGTAGRFNPLPPTRIVDTRPSLLVGTNTTWQPNQTQAVTVLSNGGIPSTGVSAVVLNVTVTDTTAPSYLTIWPAGTAQPVASNLNFVAGQTVPNRVVVPVGTGGQIDVYNLAGTVDVIIDVNGWITNSTATTGSQFTSTSPVRIIDTRLGPPFTALSGAFTGAQSRGFNVSALPPAAVSAKALVMNVTVTDTTAAGYLTVYPGNVSPVPLASDLNWVHGLTVPNFVVVQVAPDGSVDIYNSAGNTDVIVDVVGWYS